MLGPLKLECCSFARLGLSESGFVLLMLWFTHDKQNIKSPFPGRNEQMGESADLMNLVCTFMQSTNNQKNREDRAQMLPI